MRSRGANFKFLLSDEDEEFGLWQWFVNFCQMVLRQWWSRGGHKLPVQKRHLTSHMKDISDLSENSILSDKSNRKNKKKIKFTHRRIY